MNSIQFLDKANTKEQIYDYYLRFTAMFVKEGYSKEEAFWIGFACLPSAEHSAECEFQVPLDDLFHHYSTIHNEEILTPLMRKTQSLNAAILRYKFLIIQKICSCPAGSRQALELGCFLLPNADDVYRQIHAGFLIIKEKRKTALTLDYIGCH